MSCEIPDTPEDAQVSENATLTTTGSITNPNQAPAESSATTPTTEVPRTVRQALITLSSNHGVPLEELAKFALQIAKDLNSPTTEPATKGSNNPETESPDALDKAVVGMAIPVPSKEGTNMTVIEVGEGSDTITPDKLRPLVSTSTPTVAPTEEDPKRPRDPGW